MESWVDLNQNYQVSNLGNIKNIHSQKILKSWRTGCGYRKIQIGHSRERYRVHRLVAEAFCKKPSDEYLVVHHKNGDRADNRADNLAWVTQKENIRLARLGNPH